MWPLSFFTSPPQMASGTRCEVGKRGGQRACSALLQRPLPPPPALLTSPQLPSALPCPRPHLRPVLANPNQISTFSPMCPQHCPWGAGKGVVLACPGTLYLTPPFSILSTFIDGKEALPDPVAAAAEFDPEAAVRGDDRLGKFAPAETACVDGVDRGDSEARSEALSPSVPGPPFRKPAPPL